MDASSEVLKLRLRGGNATNATLSFPFFAQAMLEGSSFLAEDQKKYEKRISQIVEGNQTTLANSMFFS